MSKPTKRRRLADRERRRIDTIKRKRGPDWFHRNAKKAGKMTPTKFNSETGSAAAKARWANHRRKETANKSTDS